MNNKAQTQTTKPPVVRQDLTVRQLLLKAKGVKVNQADIGAAVQRHQTYVCKAMKNPESHPEVARMIEKYFDTLDAQNKSTAAA